MSQVGSPSTTARPAPTAPAVTGAAVTPTPTDQATGNAPRHQGGGQSAPQQQQPPQTPAPPAPAVTLAGALTALFSGQPVKATVEASANGQVILRLPEAQLVIAAEAIEAARGEVLVLKLVAATPNPAIIVTGRNGRPVADPAPVPVTIEPVVEQPAGLVPPISRRPALPTTIPPLLNIGPAPAPISAQSSVPLPAASGDPALLQPQVPPAKAPIAAFSAPAAPIVLIDADLPPVHGEAAASGEAVVVSEIPVPRGAPRTASLLLQVTQPLRSIAQAPVAPPAPAAASPVPPVAPSTVVVTMESPAQVLAPSPQQPVARPQVSAAPPSPAPIPLAMAEPDAPLVARSPVPAPVSIKVEADPATTRQSPPREQSQPAPIAMTPLPTRRTAEGPVPFVPPAIPPEALRPSVPQPSVALRTMTPPIATPSASASRVQAEPAKVISDNRPAAAPTAPANPAAPSATPPDLVPIEVEPLPPPDAPIDRRAASAWTALWATARMDPVAAERIRDMLQPKAGGRLGGGLAFLVSALRGGKLAEWLGAEDSARIDRPSRPVGLRTVEAEFRDLARMAQERGPDGWRATPLAVLDGGAVQPVMLYVHRPPRRRKNDPSPGDASERFMLDLKLSRAGPMRIDGLLRPKALDVIVRTERSVPARIQRDLRQVFTTSLEGAGLGGTLAFQKVDRLPPPPSMAADSKPHHAVLA